MEYSIKQLLFDVDDKSLQQVVDLQNIVYQNRTNFTLEGFRFWYLDNPVGRVISFNAFYGELLVAHYACVPIKLLIGGEVTLGLLDIATVTHPDHRGKGLFKTLAKTTYDYAAKNGYKFIIGVANANSFPGYMKYFNFTFVAKLDVKWGWGVNSIAPSNKLFSAYWDKETLNWRTSKPKYSINGHYIYGKYGNYPLIKTLMGCFPSKLLGQINVNRHKNFLRPLNLYVGLGADLSQEHYFNVPKFIKHSPFNLIFLDLTGGKLPPITKDNIFFQLIDFDVA